MKRKKILFVHANNCEVGGADLCLFKMVYEMNLLGYETLVLLSKKTRVIDLYNKYQLPVIIKPILRFKKTKNPIKILIYLVSFIKSLIIIINVINKNNIDIVHSNDLLDFSANIAARIKGIKSIQHVRMVVNKYLRFFLRKITLIFSDKILVVSMGLKELMYTKNDYKVSVLYDWIDMDLVEQKKGDSNIKSELNISDDTKIIGCVGRIEPWKGQHLLIEAARIVIRKFEKCAFVFVGGTVKGKEYYLGKLKKLVSKYKLEDKIFFLGERKDVANLFQQFYFSVHTSVEPDPLPGVVLESLYNECVVLGAKGGGVPEEIIENETGLLYEPGNYIELAEKMIYLLLHEDKIKNFKVNARNSVLTKFDKNKIVAKLHAIYSELLEQN